jgi:hypothetical protein
MSIRIAPLALLSLSLACATSSQTSSPPPAPPPPLDKLARADFNRIAQERNLPLFWRDDANGNNALDPDELSVLWGIAGAVNRKEWVDAGGFTQKLRDAYAAMQQPLATSALPPEEQARIQIVIDELAQGRPTLLRTPLDGMSEQDRAIIENVLAAADVVERIYARQLGTEELLDQATDPPSKTLMFRNHGPFCDAPKTEKNPDCNALASKPKKISGLYPASLQNGVDTKFCADLEKRKDADKLMHQFVVVQTDDKGQLQAVPYNVAYKSEMEAVSAKLRAAGAAITTPDEAPFKAYLEAAAQAFLDNHWEPADEAWAKMNAENSKWYLRIGPDETYAEPCSRKAMFHVSFARINQESLDWQRKLDPHKTEMEKALADLAGKPYKAREVKFHLPDFIDIVLNAGDARDNLGGTIGQSLPNWGPVANEGRGRTVAMVNLYQDKDSEAAWREQASSLLCAETFEKATYDPKLAVMSTVLHEAAHNLGPAHEYKVNGKTDDQIFGGAMASMLEELKAQTAALYFSEWLVQKGVVDAAAAQGAHLRDVTWAFGHISAGMYNAEGKIKPYSQLAAIQMGTLFKQGALVWRPEEKAANGNDVGCFQVDFSRWKPAVDDLAKVVLGIKGRGDKALAEKTRKSIVDDDAEWTKRRNIITERWLRTPKASFVYAIE